MRHDSRAGDAARRATVRRRRRGLAAAAVAAFVVGIAIGAGAEETTEPPQVGRVDGASAVATARGATRRIAPAARAAAAVDGLSLEQQVGQTLMLRFAGTSPPAYVRRVLRRRQAAGVILFRDNVVSPAQVRSLTAALRAAGGNPLIAVDQEGGDIRIVPWAPPVRSAPRQGAAGTARADAKAAARALRNLGITVSLAPVADVPSVGGAALGGRELARDPERASDAVADAVRGWEAGGVAATAKHFPGLGGATVNTDFGPATIRRSRAQLQATDLPPFAAAIDAGVPLVMIGHARYPALDPDRIASQSRPILQDLLRRRLGFGGVVVTDSMEARASIATGSIETVSERAVRAGADLVLLTGRGSYRPVFDHLLAQARRSPAFRLRVKESAARVLALRARYSRR